MKRLSIRARQFATKLGFWIGRPFPTDHRVVLATSHARVLRGNLAAIAEGLDRHDPPIAHLDLCSFPRPGWRGRVIALWSAIVAGFRIARARVFVVDDYFFPLYVVTPRPTTTVVQAWHGCGAFKKFGLSVLDKSFGADETLVTRVDIHSHYDVCLVSSMAVAPHYAEAFGAPLSQFRSDLGIPRTDVLFGEARIARTVAAIRSRYAIPADKRTILYAPTFRGDTIGAARTPTDLDLAAVHAALGADHVLLMRLHPFVRASAPIPPELAGFAIDVSDYPDVNELLLASDLLVTDYSSVIYEFSLLGRGIAFFAPDHDEYERERGFYFDYRTGVPGPIAETTEELIAILRERRFDLARVEAFRRASFDVADGTATDRFIEAIVAPTLVGRA